MPRRGVHEGSIRRRVDGRYEARITLPGTGRRHSVYGGTREEVFAQLTELLGKLQRGQNPLASGHLTLGTYLTQWLQQVASVSYDANVYQTYRGYAVNHILPVLGKTRLNRLTVSALQSFLNSRLQPCGPKQRPLSPLTIRQLHMLLGVVLGAAEREGLVEKNLATLVRPPRVERHRARYYTPEQAKALLATLPGHPLGALYGLAIFTGFRLGELLGISWTDINWETGSLVLTHQLKRFPGRWELREPKQGSVRASSLPPVALAMLEHHRGLLAQRTYFRPPPTEWAQLIFRREDGYPYHEDKVSKDLHLFLKSQGLPDLVPHELRHTAASLLIESGASLKEVSEFLGHSQISVTANTYAHLYLDQAQRNAKRLEGLLGG